MPTPLPQQDPGVSAPPRVAEGGVLDITVNSGVKEVWVGRPGRGSVRVPVHNGRAEYRLPPGIGGGTILIVSDMNIPRPSSTRVEVVGNQ